MRVVVSSFDDDRDGDGEGEEEDEGDEDEEEGDDNIFEAVRQRFFV